MKILHPLVAVLLIGLLWSCNSTEVQKPQIQKGFWKANIELNDSTLLPLVFDWKEDHLLLFNSSETIVIKEVSVDNDSVHIHFPVFNTSMHLKIENASLKGYYIKNDAEDYRLPVTAIPVSEGNRFTSNQPPCCSLNKKWKVVFRPNQENLYLAIGEFEQAGPLVTGTFRTETGDYRFLSGTLDHDSLKLAGFDGTHLYVFKAVLTGPDMLSGTFFSGKSRADQWIASRDDNFELSDPETLTFLKPEYDSIHFKLPVDAENQLSFQPSSAHGKVTIIQILGSWCGNCMDESRYLQNLFEEYHSQGLDIIGISFERKDDPAIGFQAIQKMKDDLKLSYPIVFAGSTKKENRESVLPQMNHIMSFPTTIYVDKNGKVRKIHTGFNGPSTSQYEDFTAQTETFILTLLAE